MASLFPFLMVIFVLGTFGLIIWIAVRQSRAAAGNLRALAQRLGLEYREAKTAGLTTRREVTGVLEGREVSFFQFTTGSGKSSQTWRAVSVRPRTSGRLTFNLHRQGLLTKVEALFGAKEATVGEAAFDRAWFLQTNDPDFLGAALVPEVRAKLMAALLSGGPALNFKLEQGVVRYAEVGSYSSAPACPRLELLLPVLHDLADIAEVAADRKS